MNRSVRVLGTALAVATAGLAVLASGLTRYEPGSQSVDYVYAPPMPPRLFDEAGVRWPFVYPLRLADRLERKYVEDRARPTPIRFFREGRLLSVDPASGAEWFPLGTDALGRDQLTRLAWGARYSLGVALLAALGALLIGTAIGGVAGASRGLVDDGLMRLSDFIVALPALYVVLAFRATLPLAPDDHPGVLDDRPGPGCRWMAGHRPRRARHRVGRGPQGYAEAARALGAGRTQILLRHLLPAAAASLAAQTTLLVPAFILAESTLSFVGLGFGEPTPSWGGMLRDAGGGRMLLEAPWLMAPALAIVLATLAVNLITGRRPPVELRTTAR